MVTSGRRFFPGFPFCYPRLVGVSYLVNHPSSPCLSLVSSPSGLCTGLLRHPPSSCRRTRPPAERREERTTRRPDGPRTTGRERRRDRARSRYGLVHFTFTVPGLVQPSLATFLPLLLAEPLTVNPRPSVTLLTHPTYTSFTHPYPTPPVPVTFGRPQGGEPGSGRMKGWVSVGSK